MECLEEGEKETARSMISDYLGMIMVLVIVIVLLLIRIKRRRDKSRSSIELFNSVLSRGENRLAHDSVRMKSYSSNGKNNGVIPNTWYHLCDSDEIKAGAAPVFIPALGLNLIVWRTWNGEAIIMDAYCPHMGANLAISGFPVTDDNCIKCPFHEWKFDENGELKSVPYLKKERKINCKSIPKYHARDWCGLLCIYYHSRGYETEPDWDLPEFEEKELSDERWQWHLFDKKDLGHLRLTPIDWVDQSGDHGHFHTLHSHILIPFTNIPTPRWITDRIGLKHELETILGDKWDESKHGPKLEFYGKESMKQLIYFRDKASVLWKGKPIPGTVSHTRELYIGPAMMVFHIPLPDTGDLKLFVTTTPSSQNTGSIMRVRVWLSNRSWKLHFWSYFVIGMSIGQLLADIEIMQNRLRRRKPHILSEDGPVSMVSNSWLKLFFDDAGNTIRNHRDSNFDCHDW